MAALLAIGCGQQRVARQAERYAARHQSPPYVQAMLQRGYVLPGMMLWDVRRATGAPLPLSRTGPQYGYPLAEAYVVRPYGQPDTVWVFFNQDSMAVVVER